MLMERLKSWITWTWTYLWLIWFILVVFLFYMLKGPLKLTENVSTFTVFFNTLTPKFYVALTGTSSLISGIILIFEWWYFRKYGTSFIEQVSLNYISPASASGAVTSASNADQSDQLGDQTTSSLANSANSNSDSQILVSSNNHSSCSSGGSCSNAGGASGVGCAGNNNGNGGSSISECKVWKNPMSLMRGAEYSKLTVENNQEPLTFYDMNLSAQDHQTFFTCDYDEGKADYEIMQRAWRERSTATRISLAQEALVKNPE